LRAGEIEYHLEHESLLQVLADNINTVRSMHGVLQELHLLAHPAIQCIVDESGNQPLLNLFSGHSRHPLVEAVVYRRDPQTQFRDLKEFVSFTKGPGNPDKPNNRKRGRAHGAGHYAGPAASAVGGGLVEPAAPARVAHAGVGERPVGAVVAAAGNEAEPPGHFTSIMHAAAVDHFYRRSSHRAFYSYNKHIAEELIPMDAAILESSHGLEELEVVGGLCPYDHEIDSAATDLPRVAAAGSKQCFFRVVHRRPAAQATLLANGLRGSSQGDSIIRVHDSVRHPGAGRAGTRAVGVSLSPKQQVHDGSLERISTSCWFIWPPSTVQ